MRHVVVTEGDRVLGVVRINTALRQASQIGHGGVLMRDIASTRFVVVREDNIVFDVIQRLWRRQAIMAVVVRGGVLRPDTIAGVIDKENVADSVAASIAVYPG
jgi:CIC family chloride channel protein